MRRRKFIQGLAAMLLTANSALRFDAPRYWRLTFSGSGGAGCTISDDLLGELQAGSRWGGIQAYWLDEGRVPRLVATDIKLLERRLKKMAEAAV